MKGRKPVGVRGIRQNLSLYLRRVESGETVDITTRGRLVARLTPADTGATPLECLAATGRATLPDGDLLDLGPPPKARPSRRLSRALREQRAERLR